MNNKAENRRTALQPENGVHPEQARGQQYYKALCARDQRFDGVFFTGVLTTGIYCRPVCGVKTPRAASCRFFHSAAAAEHAGFRPCLRCRPELAPYALQQNLAHRIWHQIAEGALNQQSLEAYAAKAGLSSRQIRRVLLQEFGVTPVELAQTQRLLFAKKLLQETGMPVTDIAFAAGFGSLRRLNALFAERYQMTPGSVRRARQHHPECIVLRLAYRPPYDWEAVIRYLAFRAIPGVETVTVSGADSAYRRTVSLSGHQGSICVKHDAAKSQLILEVTNTLTPVLFQLMARVREQFDLEASPLQIADNLGNDPLIAPLVSAHPGWRVPGHLIILNWRSEPCSGSKSALPVQPRLRADWFSASVQRWIRKTLNSCFPRRKPSVQPASAILQHWVCRETCANADCAGTVCQSWRTVA
jgi:AraC family transcriptional regulator of adaptative response / DNA-3-methyladenine glycosylase II